MKLCSVYGCNYANTHITSFHKCGKCLKLGHGQVECGNAFKIGELEKLTTIIPFDLQCSVPSCKSIILHTTDGHQCSNCKKFGHDGLECPVQKWSTKIERGTIFGQTRDGYLEKKELQLQARKQLGLSEHKVYTKLYAGMGCIWYARRNNNFEKIELFFMHSDNWGQYGPLTDDRPKLNDFIDGYICVDKE